MNLTVSTHPLAFNVVLEICPFNADCSRYIVKAFLRGTLDLHMYII